MQTSRRGFVGLVASAATMGFVSKLGEEGTLRSLEWVRPSTPYDFSSHTIPMAAGQIGPGPYQLYVHPEMVEHARSALCRAYPVSDWRRDYTIMAHRGDDMDEWYLVGPRRGFYSEGG